MNTFALVKRGKMLYLFHKCRSLIFFLSFTNTKGGKRFQFYREGIICYIVESL